MTRLLFQCLIWYMNILLLIYNLYNTVLCFLSVRDNSSCYCTLASHLELGSRPIFSSNSYKRINIAYRLVYERNPQNSAQGKGTMLPIRRQRSEGCISFAILVTWQKVTSAYIVWNGNCFLEVYEQLHKG